MRAALCALADHPDCPARLRAVLMNVVFVDPAAAREALDEVDPAERDLLRGACLARLTELEQALAPLDTYVCRARACDDADALLWGLAEQGRTLCMLGDVSEGVALLEEALLMSRDLGARNREAAILLALGFVEGEQGRTEPYARITRQAVDMFRAVGDTQGLAHALCNLGGALQSLLNLAEAEACYAEALEMAHPVHGRYIIALARSGQGGVAFARGDVAAGLDRYAEAEAVLVEIGRVHQVAYHELLIGRHLLKKDLATEAQAHIERALRLAGPLRLQRITTQALSKLAAIFEASGDYKGACEVLQRQVAALEANIEDRVTTARRHAAERQRGLVAQRNATAERELREQLEARNRELQAALAEQQRLREDLERLSQTDALTGLYNRRHLESMFVHEMARIVRRWAPLTVLMLDLDRFKDVNDTHGHPVGDEVLIGAARRLRDRVRASDCVARWGGEEFCIMLPETDLAGGALLGAALRSAFADLPFATSVGPLRVTVSVGVATRNHTDDIDSLIARADRALYAAKHAGRDGVVTEASTSLMPPDGSRITPTP